MNIYDLPSWSRDKLTAEQAAKYTTSASSEAFHSMRTTFKVVCNRCKKIIHESTTSPSSWIEIHEQRKCEESNELENN